MYIKYNILEHFKHKNNSHWLTDIFSREYLELIVIQRPKDSLFVSQKFLDEAKKKIYKAQCSQF